MADKTGDSGSIIVTVATCFLAWSAWHWVMDSKLRYSLQYGTSTDQVSVVKRPSNCDLFFAPIGEKGCDYEKVVVIVKRGFDVKTNRRIISYDDGQHWAWDDDGTQPAGTTVSVAWDKVEE